jgi:hypothetical protein
MMTGSRISSCAVFVLLVAHVKQADEFLPVELRRRAAEQRLQRRSAGDETDLRTIPRRAVVEEIRRDHAARALHVLHHEGGLARQMFRHVARHHARIKIVGAAGVEANDHAHAAPLVKSFDALLRLRRRAYGEQACCA